MNFPAKLPLVLTPAPEKSRLKVGSKSLILRRPPWHTCLKMSACAAIVYTDIDRDGTGQGINIVSTIALAQSTSIPVIASGGVGSVKDLELVRDAGQYGVEGVVVGKALYDGRISPQEALKVAAGGE